MTRQNINIGSTANDGTGDPLRTAFDKINDNFVELYGSDNDINTLDANLDVNNFSITTGVTNGNITVTPNGTGNINLGALKFNGTSISSDDSTQITIAENIQTTGTLNVSGATTLGSTLAVGTSLALATGATVTGIDNGGLATGSATLLATQGAIKTYVDSRVGGITFVGDDSSGINIDNNGTLYIQGGTGVTTSTNSDGTLTISTSGVDVSGGNVSIAVVSSQTSKGNNSIAIGRDSGTTSQGNNAIALGPNSGRINQGTNAIAIGPDVAGYTGQGNQAIAIGMGAGRNNQGAASIALGVEAGFDNQHANTIVISGYSGAAQVNTTQSDSLFISPIRNTSGTTILQYNASTKEITYSASPSISGTLTTADITTVGNQTISGSLTTGSLNIGDLNITPEGKITTDTNGDVDVVPSGTGAINLTGPTNVTGVATVTGQLNTDNLRLDGNTISATTGGITLQAAAGQNIQAGSLFIASEINVTTGEFTTLRTDALQNDTSNGDLSISTQGTGTVDFETPSQTTVGAGAGGSALPGDPVGYLKFKLNGTEIVVPYWNAS
jgi:hypothetical protein